MIKHADPTMMPQLIELWHHVFGDTTEYVSAFMAHHFSPKTVYVCEEQGEVYAAAYSLPARVHQGAEILQGRYLYAIATREDKRGSHYFRQIFQLMKQEEPDTVFFLVPEPGVIPYYESLGFQMVDGIREGILEASFTSSEGLKSCGENASGPVISKIESAARYKRIRDERFGYQSAVKPDSQQNPKPGDNCFLRQEAILTAASSEDGYIEWDENYIAWALEDIQMAGGEILELRLPGEKGSHVLCGILRKDAAQQDWFDLIETTMSGEELLWYRNVLLENLHCKTIKQRSLKWMTEKPLDENTYVNLVLN